MNVLFSGPKFPRDASTTTMTQLACRLADRGHDVRGVHEAGRDSTDYFPVKELPAHEMGSPWWARLWWYYRGWRRQIDAYLDAHNPDVVVSNRRTHVPTVQGARGHEIPVVAIIEGLGFTRFDPGNHHLDKTPHFRDLPPESKVQYPFVRSLFRQQRRAFPEFAEVVALSGFLADVVKKSFGVDARVLRTMVDLESVRADDVERTHVTMVNPRSELKGADVFLEVAQAFPDERFLVAGEFATDAHRRTAESLDNVTRLGWVEDMRDVYARTKLLLVPSIVEEGGPRVVVEAFANGIPVVGTDRGGTPEFIGDVGAVIENPYDIGEWQRAIRATLDDYDRLSALARNRAPLFDAAETLDRYEELLASLAE